MRNSAVNTSLPSGDSFVRGLPVSQVKSAKVNGSGGAAQALLAAKRTAAASVTHRMRKRYPPSRQGGLKARPDRVKSASRKVSRAAPGPGVIHTARVGEFATRADPDALLRRVQADEARSGRAKLKIYFG